MKRGDFLKVALLSATKLSLEPIETAIQDADQPFEYFHLLDTSLLTHLRDEGISEGLIQRFEKLIHLALDSGANCVQFTCSAFNGIAEILQPKFNIPLLRSDESMLDEALQFKRIGLVATIKETPVALEQYLKTKNPNVIVKAKYEDNLMDELEAGNTEYHDKRVEEMAKELEFEVDVIVLSQYSIARLTKNLNLSIPVLNAPQASIRKCRQILIEKEETDE